VCCLFVLRQLLITAWRKFSNACCKYKDFSVREVSAKFLGEFLLAKTVFSLFLINFPIGLLRAVAC
jgi:hypothetical protein